MRIITAMLLASIAFGTNAATVSSGTAPDISGTWQGTLQPPAPPLRLVFQISRDSGTWKATMYSVDTTPDQTPVDGVSLTGAKVLLEVDSANGRYQGTLSADGSAFHGTWMLGARSASLDLRRATQATAWPLYNTGYKVQFVTVDQHVKLEVVDWGGSGRPVILLAGLGNTAHVFDRFAPKLTAWYHVYGITRRGFGDSSAPTTGYSVDRLGKDVLAVMDALKIDRPVLIGHSVAGQELSYIGSQNPNKIAGLVYLEAGYGYAFYARPQGTDVPTSPPDVDLYIDGSDLQRKLAQILFPGDSSTRVALINELLNTDLTQLRQDLQVQRRDLQAGGPNLAQVDSAPAQRAILAGMDRFTKLNAPILAIYADPHSGLQVRQNTPANIAQADATDKASIENQIAALKRYNPSARIVRLDHVPHYLFISNEPEVLKDVHAFIDTLPSYPSPK